MIQSIGRGGFASVILVEHKKTHERFAAKINDPRPSEDITSEKVIVSEISILVRVQAPTIIRLIGFSLKDFYNNNNFTLLMEYKSNGSLKDLITKEFKSQAPPEYDNTTKQIILCGIAHGMMILHSHRVIHRDLKPANVLLDSQYRPFITDFGLSKYFDPDLSKSISHTECGTALYMAPEVFNGNPHTQESDVYSFGILMFEVITGQQAFRDFKSSMHLAIKVIDGERPKSDIPIPPNFQALLEACWHKEPRKRPSFKTLFTQLSLSFSDDEFVSHLLHTQIDEETDDLINTRFCLENVDYQCVLDYVDDITNQTVPVGPPPTKQFDERFNEMEIRHQKEIKALKQSNQANVEKIKQLTEQNEKIREEMESLRQLLLLKLTFPELREKIQREKITEIIIPSSKKMIDKEAFYDCTSLVKVEIPTSVTLIQNLAFFNCTALKTLVFPSSIQSIGELAFGNCFSLKNLEFPNSLRKIESGAFRNCRSLTKIIIPSSVELIDKEAFLDCTELTQVTIEGESKTIDPSAFWGCTKLSMKSRKNLKAFGDLTFDSI